MNKKVKIIGGIMGIISTLVGIVIAYYIWNTQDKYFDLFLKPPIFSAITVAFILSIYIGSKSAIKIIIESENFVRVWCLSGLLTVIGAELVGVFVYIIFVNSLSSMESIFSFFIILIYSIIPIILFGSILGYVVKKIGEKID